MSVKATNLDGMTLNLVGTVYQGPPGNQGIPGDQGIPGIDGREVEIQKGNGYIQWRYVGDSAWINIISLSEITGPKGQDGINGKDGQRGLQGIPGENGLNGADGIVGSDGEDGREIELQKGATYIQWRYVGDSSWINLVSLAELKGAKGDQGQSFVPNATEALANRGNYDNESPGFAFLAIDEGMIYFRLDPTGWSNGMSFGKGEQGVKGDPGDPGADGREVEFQKTATHIQWRYVGSSTWINLVPLADLKGVKGDKGDPGAPGTNGTNGQDGAPGANGVDGVDGQDGADGVSPNLSIGTVSTLAPGASATATLTGDFPDLALNLGIPQGAKGDPGEDGTGGEGSYDGPVIDVPTAAGKVLMSGNTPPGSTYWGDLPAGGSGISPPVAGDAGKVLTAGDALGTTYWATPSGGGGGSGPVIPMNTSGDEGKVLLAGALAGSTYWGALPSGGYPVPVAADAGKFLRAGDVVGTAYWATPEGGASLPALVNNAGKVLAVNTGETGTEWIDLPTGGGGGGGESDTLKAMRTTDMTNQTTTLEAVLGVNVAAGRLYRMKFVAMTRPTNLAQGIRMGFLGSFGNSNMQVLGTYRGTAGAKIELTAVAKADVMVFPNHEKGNDGNLLILEGIIHVSSAGTFQIGFAVDTAWDYCAIVKGASLTMQDMGALAV